ncbi:MAG: DUF222 domain-containing protein [Acidimicrobiales bacterium]
MEMAVQNSQANEALDLISTGIDQLFARGIAPASARDAVAWIRTLEKQQRRLSAAGIELLRSIDNQRLHFSDGHHSAKVMMRHNAKLSAATSLRRDRCRQVLDAMPQIAAAFEAGQIGMDQVALLGKVHANRRIRYLLTERDAAFAQIAKGASFLDFENAITTWERLVDQDGADQDAERNHNNRRANLTQNAFDLSWDLDGSFSALQGAAINEIFDRFIDIEFKADWDSAQMIHGIDTRKEHLARTNSQRRADAVDHIFALAANNLTGTSTVGFVHNIVWSSDTYEAMLVAAGANQRPIFDPKTFRCETIDGVLLDPSEAFINSLTASFRRVVVDAKGAVIDLSHARLFTGLARHAINLQSPLCIWPGCYLVSSRCQGDHLHPYGEGGRTNPDNGAPLCGKHNRHKNQGFVTQRDPDGAWRTFRPDLSEIT